MINTRQVRVVITVSDRRIQIDNGYIKSINIIKSIGNFIGTCTITAKPSLISVIAGNRLQSQIIEENFFDNVNLHYLVEVYINNNLRFQGILDKPTFTGRSSTGKSSNFDRDLILRCSDFGYLFQEINKLPHQFDPGFIRADISAFREMASIISSDRNIPMLSGQLFRAFFRFFENSNNGIGYTFPDNTTILNRFGNNGINLLLVAPGNSFYVNFPIHINFFTGNLSYYEVLRQIADPTFSEVFGETYSNGDIVTIGSGRETIQGDGYRIVIRPRPFSDLRENTIIDIGENYYDYSAMKDTKNIYNVFAPIVSSWRLDANFSWATNQFVKNGNSIAQYGYKILMPDIPGVWSKTDEDGGRDNGNNRQNAITNDLGRLARVLDSWYRNSERFLSGQIIIPYHDDIKLGNSIRFRFPRGRINFLGYIEGYSITVDFNTHRVNTSITYSRALDENIRSIESTVGNLSSVGSNIDGGALV